MRLPHVIRRLAAAASLLGVLSASGAAQERELHWPSISVVAHLDADGRLRVRERQEIRLVGDWNGAERLFDVPMQQKLSLLSLVRIDAVTGQAVPLTEGDLDVVDGFDWSNEGTALRWRSRLPSDPPFTGQVLTYEMELEYENILVPENGGYRLAHDFSFADRYGTIDRFTLTLTFDDAWEVLPSTPTTWEASPLPPGQGYVVAMPLRYRGAGLPSAVFVGASSSLRQGLAAMMALAIVAMLIALVRRERGLGRFAPLPDAVVNPSFIEEHVLVHPPEVIGTMWDDSTSAPEVAATLARLVQEGKLTSRVEPKSALLSKRDVLHLRLVAARTALAPHEAALVAALFEDGHDETNTDAVRARYKSTGFDPASVIKPLLEATSLRHAPKLEKDARPSPKRTLMLFGAALATTVVAIVMRPIDGAIIAPAFGAMVPFYLFGAVWAAVWRNRVAGFAASALGFLIPLAVIGGGISIAILFNDSLRATGMAYVAVVLWALTCAHSITMLARTHDTPERLVTRKRLKLVRDFFAIELRKERPQLRDAWFPYVIAFGLGREADKWFRAFGSATSGVASTSSYGGSSGSSSTGGSSWSGFGGGGGFSGAGSAGSFAAAVGGMAASVPSPSSSSSGGGGGGGSSSGGGGGGGW